MIYLILSAASAFFGLTAGLGPTTLLRPLLDAVSPLSPASVSMLAAMATLCAGLVSAFFALAQPLPLHQDELLLLAIGAAGGGILGDLAAARFYGASVSTTLMLQNALLFTLIALPSVYFSTLSGSLRPFALSRFFAIPIALFAGLVASFLAFGAEPLSLMLYYLLFDAEDDESNVAALTIALFSMAGKLLTLFIRQGFHLPDANALLFILPGALLGALLAMIPGLQRSAARNANALLKLSLFTSMINMAAAAL